ncbi:MAG: flagella basal body P-ring formation protein FlgA [Gammaproteobacteria bacterium]|nr:MAG: flagella basal body P-ring formation protein FlgA [Gammaproteobacteria bacterium]
MFLANYQSEIREYFDNKTKKHRQFAFATYHPQRIGQKTKFHRLLAYFVLFFLSHASFANETLDRINTTANEYLTHYLTDWVKSEKISRFEFTLGKIDPRLSLSRCARGTLSVEILSNPMKTSRNSLKVACGRSWSIVISAKITLFVPTLVSTRSLNRGDIVAADDITTKEIALRELRYGHYRYPSNLIGLSVKRTIVSGQAFSPPQLQPPQLVSKGDNVVISAKSDILTVRMTGTALTNGKKGQQVLVKNNTSKRIVKGFVLRKGLIEIPL